MREELKNLKGKTFNVTGYVVNVQRGIRDRKSQIRVVLKDVNIAGHHIEHIVMFPPARTTRHFEKYKKRQIKFKGKVYSYIKNVMKDGHSTGIKREDYSIKYESSLEVIKEN